MSDLGVRVLGAGRAEAELRRQTESWHRQVAEVLGLDPADEAAVWVHRRPGVSWTDRVGIHLCDSWRGEPDIDRLPHELAHLIAGQSSNRFLSEGLAVHVEARLGLGAPSWPCYRLDPDSWVTVLRQHGQLRGVAELAASMRSIRLSELASAGGALENPDADETWRAYLVAGSFTGYLFGALDRRTFWSVYRGDWASECDWNRLEQNWLQSIPHELTSEKKILLAGSIDDSKAQLAAVATDAKKLVNSEDLLRE